MLFEGIEFTLRSIKFSETPYLNVGCGRNTQPGFINLDYIWQQNVQLCWDITNGVPLPNNSMKGIFTEHCLEHITFEQWQTVLSEFHRILKPGGNVRIITPDAELYVELYQKYRQGDNVEIPCINEEDLSTGYAPIIALNRISRDHGHQFIYDAETLKILLENAGFIKVEKESFIRGRDTNLLIESKKGKAESLYVEASKDPQSLSIGNVRYRRRRKNHNSKCPEVATKF